MLRLLAPRGGSVLGGEPERAAGTEAAGLILREEKKGSRNTRERKGWQNKDLKLQRDAKKKEETSGLGPGVVGRGWAGGPCARLLPKGRGGLGWAGERGLGSAVRGGGT